MCEDRLRTDGTVQDCMKQSNPIFYINGKDKYAYYYWGSQKNQENALIYIDKSIKDYESPIKVLINERKNHTLKLKITELRKFKRMQYYYPQQLYDTGCYLCNEPIDNHDNICLFCFRQFCSKCITYKSQYVCPYCTQDFKTMNKCIVCDKEEKEGKKFCRCSNCCAPFHSKCRGILTYSNTEHWLCCQCEEQSLLSYMGFLLPPTNIEKYPDSLDRFLTDIKMQDPSMYYYFKENIQTTSKPSSSSSSLAANTKIPITFTPSSFATPIKPEEIPEWSPDQVKRQFCIFDCVLYSVVDTIKQHPQCGIFIHPVNPVQDCVPDYLEIIKKPMDIDTVEYNIHNKIYFQFADFHDDIMRIWNNCIKYHGFKGNDDFRNLGEEMKKFYIERIYNKLCELKWNYLERDDDCRDSEDENNYGGTNESSFKAKYPKHGILKRYCKCLNPNRTGMVVCHSNWTRDHCHGYVHLSCFDLDESDYNDSFICPLCRDKTVMKKEVIIKPDKLSDKSSIVSSAASSASIPLQPTTITTPSTPGTPAAATAATLSSVINNNNNPITDNKEVAVKRNLPYAVDKIIGKRFLGNDGIVQYRVFWKNCDLNGASWEPKEDVEINCQSLIEQYEKGFVLKEEHFEENRYVIGLYEFNTTNADELPFHKGDKIKVISPPEDHNDWKIGELNGRQGQFPYNYVKECPIVKEKWIDELIEENILMAGYLQDRSKVSLEYFIEKNK